MSHKNRKMLILLDKLHIIAVTFNQVVRGSSPRCLMEKKMVKTLGKSRVLAIFRCVKITFSLCGFEHFGCLRIVSKFSFEIVMSQKCLRNL